MNQHQDYDKIFKETIEKIGTPILQKLLGIEAATIENVPTGIPRTIERRADFLKIGIDNATLLKTLYHLEFQSDVHLTMLQRLLVYFSLFFEKFKLPIKQYVIYLGTGNWTAETHLSMPNISFHYEVICLNTIDYELFVNSEQPEEIILAILADFKKQDKSKVIQRIIKSLKDKTKNKKKLEKLIMQLEILSNLRNLQLEITKQLSTMSINYDVTKDLRYLEGKEIGIDLGIDLGKEIGIDLGIATNTKALIRNMLSWGKLSIKEIAEATKVSIDDVIAIHNEMNGK